MSLGKGRPRKLAVVHELSGAFEKNPQRRRYDPDPTAPLDPTPPDDLPAGAEKVWEELLDELPNIVITKSDKQALKILTLSVHASRVALEKGNYSDFFKAEAVARNWLIHFGMTPLARTKFSTKTPPGKQSGNPFKNI